jgi:hypothetical protein
MNDAPEYRTPSQHRQMLCDAAQPADQDIRQERFDAAISALLQAEEYQTLFMKHWRSGRPSDGIALRENLHSIPELHACGNRACFLGHLSLTVMWQQVFGLPSPLGEPAGGHALSAPEMIMSYLMIPYEDAYGLIYGNIGINQFGRTGWSHYYNRSWGDVRPEDVIAKLKELRSLSYDFS